MASPHLPNALLSLALRETEKNRQEIAKLQQRVTELENAIKAHRTGVRYDPCHEWDSELWAILGDGDTEWPLVSDSAFSRMKGCLLYLKTHEIKKRNETK